MLLAQQSWHQNPHYRYTLVNSLSLSYPALQVCSNPRGHHAWNKGSKMNTWAVGGKVGRFNTMLWDFTLTQQVWFSGTKDRLGHGMVGVGQYWSCVWLQPWCLWMAQGMRLTWVVMVPTSSLNKYYPITWWYNIWSRMVFLDEVSNSYLTSTVIE